MTPEESRGLGDRGFIRERTGAGFETLAKDGRATVFVAGNARRAEDVALALLSAIEVVTDDHVEHPISLPDECPPADDPELVQLVGSDIDVARGGTSRGQHVLRLPRPEDAPLPEHARHHGRRVPLVPSPLS